MILNCQDLIRDIYFQYIKKHNDRRYIIVGYLSSKYTHLYLQARNHLAAIFVIVPSRKRRSCSVTWWLIRAKNRSSASTVRRVSHNVKHWKCTCAGIRSWIRMTSNCTTVSSVRKHSVTPQVSVDIWSPIPAERTNAWNARNPSPTKAHCWGIVVSTRPRKLYQIVLRKCTVDMFLWN